MYKHVKRGLDVVAASIGLIVSMPILAIVYVAVRADSRGPAIFHQKRLGLNGAAFTMLKFRSMSVGAEAGGVYESVGDPRVTRVGRILRRSSIDELPQLVNILRGDMSLIGPRPTLEYHPCRLEEYTSEQRVRFSARPGITGWAQVQGRKSLAWENRLEYDVEYVRKMSFLFDLKILLKTVLQVLSNADNINVSKTAQVGDESVGSEKRWRSS